MLPFTPHGRTGGAGRRVAREKQHDPELGERTLRLGVSLLNPRCVRSSWKITNVIAKKSL